MDRLAFWSLIAQLLANFFGRWLRGGGPAPGASEVSPAWVQRALRSQPALAGVRVKSVEVLGLDGNRGYCGAMSRLRVEYHASSPAGPATFILKMSPAGRDGRRGVLATKSFRDAFFYASPFAAAPRAAGLVPTTYAARASPWLGEYCILMEDLTLAGAKPVNFVFGNQCWGVPEPVDPPREAGDMLRLMYESAARVHAAHWRDAALLRDSRLKAARWMQGDARGEWEEALAWTRRAYAALLVRPDLKLSQRLRGVMGRSLEATSWARFQAHVADMPFTLCHGDFHASNMVYVPGADQDQLRWFDWSEVGPWEPATDLAQTVVSDVHRSRYAEIVRPALQGYLAELRERGVLEADYSWDQLLADFARGGVERWTWVLAIMGALPNCPLVCVQYLADQLDAFVEEFVAEPDAAEYPLNLMVRLGMDL